MHSSRHQPFLVLLVPLKDLLQHPVEHALFPRLFVHDSAVLGQFEVVLRCPDQALDGAQHPEGLPGVGRKISLMRRRLEKKIFDTFIANFAPDSPTL